MLQGYIKPNWSSMQKYQTPSWYKNAKFGIWAHWGPQSQPEYGDWYAYYMYKQGGRTQLYHLEHYGHPSEVGFKDIIHEWQAKAWNPEHLMKLYKRAGAQYFVAMANHHDNFDLWDSRYHEWNATTEGPRNNIIARWAKAARQAGMRFGVSVHSSRAWEWYNMTESSDAKGDKAGVTYDGRLTKADGHGTWWEGKDPQQLYARGHALQGSGAIGADGKPTSIPDSAWCEQFYNRTMDLINSYQPDLVYFDDTQLPLWPASDVGLRIAAHYYNSNRAWHNGVQEGVITAKKLTPEQQQCLVWDVECGSLDSINAQPWQTCSCLGTWHYDRTWYEDNKYKSAQRVVRMLADVVSKNGNLLLSVPIRADGTIDEREEAILDSLGTWMKTNGESIFETHPWKVFGEGPDAETIHPMRDGIGFNESKKVYTSRDIRFTHKGDAVYAILMVRPSDGQVLIRSLAGAASNIKSVQVLGKGRIRFKCDEQGLALSLPAGVSDIPVVKITLRQL
jgi:alpha-L-fucosidase